MKNVLKIFVAGGTGFLGKRVINKLQTEKLNFVTTSFSLGVDFRDIKQIEAFFRKEKPDIVINCAAYVGGIRFGLEHEGEIYYNNILISTNLIECSRRLKVKRFINPISNCSYPDTTNKEFREDEWWTGPLHPSVLVYGFVKKATWVQSYAYNKQYHMDFINFLVPNMFGPDDHFDEKRSHALGALIMKIVKAKENKLPSVDVWGTGKPVREWLYVDDCVEAMIKAISMEPSVEPINLGQGFGVTIFELADMIKQVVGYRGKLIYDPTKPDGAPYKVMDISRMLKYFMGWKPPTSLYLGIEKTVEWYYKNIIKK